MLRAVATMPLSILMLVSLAVLSGNSVMCVDETDVVVEKKS